MRGLVYVSRGHTYTWVHVESCTDLCTYLSFVSYVHPEGYGKILSELGDIARQAVSPRSKDPEWDMLKAAYSLMAGCGWCWWFKHHVSFLNLMFDPFFDAPKKTNLRRPPTLLRHPFFAEPPWIVSASLGPPASRCLWLPAYWSAWGFCWLANSSFMVVWCWFNSGLMLVYDGVTLW